MPRTLRQLSFLLFIAALSACNSGGSQSLDPDAGPLDGDAARASSDASECECADDEVCVEGGCEAIPAQCPCPTETYCDIASDTCVRGCLDDSGCDSGRICSDERSCGTGCRQDQQCAAGSICQDELCQVGCREDDQCSTSGDICEDLSCRAGCRDDSQCPIGGEICEELVCRAGCREAEACTVEGELCHLESFTCAVCDDPDEPGDTRIDTRGRGAGIGSATATRVLCNDPNDEEGDDDRIVWRPSFDPNGGIIRTTISASFQARGMEPGSATFVTVVNSRDQVKSYRVDGDGGGSILGIEMNLQCNNVCTFQQSFRFTTTSRTPVTVVLEMLAR